MFNNNLLNKINFEKRLATVKNTDTLNETLQFFMWY